MRAFIIALIYLGISGIANAQHTNAFHSWAATPPMGWNSYDAYYGTVTEKQFLKEVDIMAEKLLPAGYEYAVLDYCWFNPGPKGWDPDHWITYDVNNPYTNKDHTLFPGMTMDTYGRLLPSPNRFPSAKGDAGFKKIGDYVHAKGMKFGIHVMRGIPREAVIKNCPVKGTSYTAKDIANLSDTCLWNESMYGVDAGKPGAQAYYNSLLDLYATWGVDFIKVDDIASPVYHAAEINMLRKAIDQCGRKIVISLSPGDAVIGYANEMDNRTNMYRVSNDVWDRWRDILHVFDLLNEWSPFIGQGSWPDADMIPFGRLCLTGYPEAHGHPNHGKREHDSFLSFEEQKTIFTLWCMARSPLMWGGAPSLSSDTVFQILGNTELLKINKSSIHNHQLYQPNGRSDNKDFRIWVAESPDQKIKYVAFFNLKESPADLEYKLKWEFWKGNYTATELWNHQVIPDITDSLNAREIPPHGVAVFKLTL